MELIAKLPFRSDACKKEIMGLIYSEQGPGALPKEDESRILERLTYNHQRETHTNCWKCGKNIKPHEISNHIVWDGDVWQELCGSTYMSFSQLDSRG